MLASSSRAFSPPLSTVSSAQGSPSPVQVKKVVIEGRSKHDGASLKMYFKVSVAVDNVLPGGSIPLFPEDNIRITQSKVHPLDERSVPYFYSSTEQPLLQKAAQALQLGPKSSRAYHTLFPVSSPPVDPTSSRRNRESTSTPPPNDERYMGYILVSGYNITLVLPKEFPPRLQSVGAGTESEGDDGFIQEVPPTWSARSARRPSSMTHKTYLHMMAALEVFVPYVITPPKGPFLVSIPVPRCLDNHLKLRISTPATNSSTPIPHGSLYSASSEDDTPGWDFLTDPPVSRKLDKPLRKNTYQQSADDEHSDSPSGPSVPGTELILGAYQSTDLLHVRWAPPAGRRKGLAKTEDGMRRVGIERTVGKTRCEVMGRERHYVKLGIMYDGVCTGLWHPGVATMLGMDIALDVKGRHVSWPEDGMAGWAVSGGNGFGGLHSEGHPGNISRKSSFESTASSTFLPTLANKSVPPPRGTASLLRAPLPNQNTPDYSFENSPGATPSPTMPPSGSASPHLSHVTPGPETKLSKSDVSPGKSITLKVNLLKLLPPTKNEFNFSVKGTILLDVEEENFVPLPTFHVLGSDKEKIDVIVSSSMHGFIQIGSHPPDGPTRTLGLREEVRCEDSVGLVFQPRKSSAVPATQAKNRTPPRVQSRIHSPRIKVEEPSNASDTRPTSAQPAHIPCVLTTVTPLPRSAQHTHCLRVTIPAYALDTDTIEFGLALPQHAALHPSSSAVDVLYASYAGRHVHAEVLPRDTDMLSPTLSGLDAFRESQIVGEMQFWVIVHLADVEADSGTVEIVYLVGDDEERRGSDIGKGKAKEEIGLDVLLPCFRLPVSRYEVEVDCPSSFDPHVKYSTLPNHHTTYANAPKLTHYWLPAGFFPVLSLLLLPSPEGISQGHKRSRTRRTADTVLKVVPQIMTLALLYLVVSMGSEVRQVRDTIDAAARALVNGVPYSQVDWGDGADPAAKHRWWTQDQFVTAVSSDVATATATTIASWERETVRPATPTVDLGEATPVPEKRPPRTEKRSGHPKAVLIPLPAVPLLSWKMPLSSEAKEIMVKGFTRAWYFLLRVWNYPLDPD